MMLTLPPPDTPFTGPTPLSLHNLTQIVRTQQRLGRTDDQIVAFLASRGWPDVSARRFVNNTLAASERQPMSDDRPQQPQPHTHKPSHLAYGISRLVFLIVALATVAVAVLNLIRF